MSNLFMNVFIDPITSAVGAAWGGSSVAVQGATWVGSEFAKVGRGFAGTPGEISAAILGAGTGAAGGFFLGSVLGAIAGENIITYFIGGISRPLEASVEQVFSQLNALSGSAIPAWPQRGNEPKNPSL